MRKPNFRLFDAVQDTKTARNHANNKNQGLCSNSDGKLATWVKVGGIKNRAYCDECKQRIELHYAADCNKRNPDAPVVKLYKALQQKLAEQRRRREALLYC